MALDRLSTALTLTVDGTSHGLVATQIEAVALDLHAWGFEADVTFVVESEGSGTDDDPLFSDFQKPALMTAALTLERSFDEVDEESIPLTATGVVLARSLEETTSEGVAEDPILLRRYHVRFVDRAQALWGQHRPVDLRVNTTYQALIDAHKPDGLTLTHSWASSSVQRPVLAIGLGVGDAPASFYDLVLWLADREGAGLLHDVRANAYSLVDTKPTGAKRVLEHGVVTSIEVILPVLRRAVPVVLNAFTDASEARQEITNAQSATGVRSEWLVRTPLASEVDVRKGRETKRARQRLAGARVTLGVLPAKPIAPGDAVTFDDDFSAALFVSGKSFRAAGVSVRATAAEDDGGSESDGQRYELAITVDLEQASDPVFGAPAWVAPRWPFELEGKVVSEIGADDEETYQIYQDAQTSVDLYKVDVPLFANARVIVAYEPIMMSGHFYFPAYKGERVLLSFEFDRAHFAGFLDWRPGARLPLDTQGNHILFGKKAASQTSLRHTYADAKPLLTLARTSDKDTQTLVIEEGTLSIVVKEDT